MDRRQFLEALGIAALGVVIPGLASAEPLRHPLMFELTSIPDVGTTLDGTKAEKARKLAFYVITRDRQRGLLSYNPTHGGTVDYEAELVERELVPGAGKIITHDDTIQRKDGDYQGVQAVMRIRDWRYTVWVANNNENSKIKQPDLISFWMRPNGTSGQDQLITFSDNGLDGRCDFGIIPKKLSGTGSDLVYWAKSDVKPDGEGLKHQSRFQNLYDETLDKLIRFYER